MLLFTSCTSVYKQAQTQTYFELFIFMCGAFLSHLVLRCTNRHQNKPISSCLCLWVGAFSRILYFDVQPGTKTNLFLVVYVYGMVLFLASCTSMYKQAPKQTYFSCLCLWGGAFTRILYFGVQTGTNTSLFNRGLVVYVYGMVLLTATCTSLYKQAPKRPFFSCLCLWSDAFAHILYVDLQAGTKTNLSLVVYVYGMVLWLASCTSLYKRHQNKPSFNCLRSWDGAFRLILYFGVQTGTITNLF